MGSPERHTVMIVESNPKGHRLMYVRLLADAALASGARVILLLSTNSLLTVEFQANFSSRDPRISIHEHKTVTMKTIATLSHKESTNRVIVPNGDRLAQLVGAKRKWSGSGEIILLIMRTSRQPSSISFLTWHVKKRLLERAELTDRVSLVRLVSALDTGLYSKAIAPDPVELSAGTHDVKSLRSLWAIDPDVYWFAVIGELSERKNLPLILDSLAAAGLRRVGIIVAGQIDKRIATAIAPKLSRLNSLGVKTIVKSAHLTNIEFDAVVQAVNCVVVAHDNEGPSGVAAKATAAGTRVLSAGAKSLRDDARMHPQNMTWVQGTIEEMSTGMRVAYHSERPAPIGGMGTKKFCRALLQ